MNKQRSAWREVVVLVAGLIAAAGCRGESESAAEVKTLDNFAADEQIVQNVCGIEFTGSEPLASHVREFARARRIEATPAMAKVVVGTLQAVPFSLLRVFAADGGRIVIAADAATRCERALPQELAGARGSARARGTRVEPLPSCWLGHPGSKDLELVVSDRPEVVRHALLRALAYYMIETKYLPVKAGDPRNANASAVAQSFAKLSTSFLSDLEARGDTASHQRLAQERAKGEDAFDLLVFAESIDSFYCSTQSRRSFETQFPKAYAVFLSDRNFAPEFGSGS